MALRRRTAGGTRWEEDNRVAPNPWAFVAVALAVVLIAGLFVLFWRF